eukprot:3860327-Karenia_brevis.AAC.1
MVAHVLKLHQATIKRHHDEHRQDHRQQLLTSPHHKKAFAYIKNQFSPPLAALRRDDGRFVTQPDHMDQLLRD